MMRWSHPELAGVCIYRESGENFQDTFHRPAPEPPRLYGGRQNPHFTQFGLSGAGAIQPGRRPVAQLNALRRV